MTGPERLEALQAAREQLDRVEASLVDETSIWRVEREDRGQLVLADVAADVLKRLNRIEVRLENALAERQNLARRAAKLFDRVEAIEKRVNTLTAAAPRW